MEDLFENYVSELNKLREAFQNELGATSEELSRAMDICARRGEAALAAFMEKVSASGMELEAAAEASSISFAVFHQASVCRTSTTDRLWITQQMVIERESQTLWSGRLQRF